MTVETLKKGIELSEEIKNTEKAIDDINTWIEYINREKERIGYNVYVDVSYNLMLSEHVDGSGNRVVLKRCRGNTEIVLGVKAILVTQLEALKKEMELL